MFNRKYKFPKRVFIGENIIYLELQLHQLCCKGICIASFVKSPESKKGHMRAKYDQNVSKLSRV